MIGDHVQPGLEDLRRMLIEADRPTRQIIQQRLHLVAVTIMKQRQIVL